jgi:uncharacterized membrane protein YkvA (DUF1232 family)
MGLKTTWLAWAKALKRQALVLWYAARHPLTPAWVKLLLALVLAYAFSPIDLIPDFIPVLGLLDEALLLPLAIWLLLRAVPEQVKQQAEVQAANHQGRIVSTQGAAVIVTIWLAALVAGLWWWLA